MKKKGTAPKKLKPSTADEEVKAKVAYLGQNTNVAGLVHYVTKRIQANLPIVVVVSGNRALGRNGPVFYSLTRVAGIEIAGSTYVHSRQVIYFHPMKLEDAQAIAAAALELPQEGANDTVGQQNNDV